jgi:hypothetical protein
MSRIITAFYQTRAEAEKVRDALKAAHLGKDVDILDHEASDAHPPRPGFLDWLGALLEGQSDKHIVDEGLRRGRFLVTAKVSDEQETQAAEIMEAANPLDLDDEQRSWRVDGWTQPEFVAGAPDSPPVAGDAAISSPAERSEEALGPSITLIGMSVRSYRLNDVARAD